MQNLPTTLTNLFALYPAWIAFEHGDNLTTTCILFAGACSFAMHIVENHKHGMPGLIKVSQSTSQRFNHLDLLGVGVIISRIAWIFSQTEEPLNTLIQNWLCFGLLGSCAILGQISEWDNQNVALRTRFIITHSLWHIFAFVNMGLFLKWFVYDLIMI